MKAEIDIAGNEICMVMGYKGNSEFTAMADFARGVNMAYCRQHGYGFRYYGEGFAEDRHLSWSKILFVQDALKSYQWVMWMDADAIITNPIIWLERFIDDKYILIVGKQGWKTLPWNAVNFGVFLVKKDPDVKPFFEKVWEDISRQGREGWEQDGVRQVMNLEPFKSKIKVVCRREFNSLIDGKFHNIGAKDAETDEWQKGDFVAHYGWRHNNILESMKKVCVDGHS